MFFQLDPDLLAGSQAVRLCIHFVRKLAGQKDIRPVGGYFDCLADAPQKSPLFPGYRDNFGAQAANDIHPFLAHPVGHHDLYGVPKGLPDGREGDAGIATGSFHDGVARFNPPGLIGFLKDVECHPVLDAAGNVELFAFGINGAFFTLEPVMDGQHG